MLLSGHISSCRISKIEARRAYNRLLMASRKKPDRKKPDPPDSGGDSADQQVFPIVGVGASAGGIEAFTELLRGLPEKPGLALVFILHQDPRHESSLPQILSR